MTDKTIHVVSHTHWDREWYFSTCDSLVLMDQTITAILNELDKNKHVNFCLDGQISIVKEYLKLRPEMKELMQRLIDEKRLFVGPWYTQTDTQLVSMSSMMNNLYYGIYESKELFGKYMNIGYLPDTFGFSNQIPMLLNQFEMKDFIFWRGIDFDKQKITPYFSWVGQDDSIVTAANLPKGYAMAQKLNTEQIFIDNILNPMLEEYDTLTDAQDILMTVGGDQQTIVKDLDQKIKQLPGHLKISNYEDFMQCIASQVKGTYCGEFREGRYSRVHKSAGSIRSSIKQSNYEAEISLSKGLEPLNVMAKEEGFAVSQNIMKEAWELLFEGQAHDGIVGCVSDSVASDILNRNKRALELSQSAQNFIKKQFAWSLNLQENEVIVFNTDPFVYNGYKTIEIISHAKAVEIEDVEACYLIESKKYDGNPEALVETAHGKFYEKEQDYYFHKLIIKVELPAMGYKVFQFHDVEPIEKKMHLQKIKNQNYEIEFMNNELILYYNNHTIHDFISLVDMGNAGDTYDFSPLADDYEQALKMNNASVEIIDDMQVMKIDCTTLLPYDLDDRMTDGKREECACQLTIRLMNDEMIYTEIDFDNKVLSHRLRLKVKAIQGQNQTIAATPGGYVLRDVYNSEARKDWNQTHVEYPIDIETNSGFVGFYGNDNELMIFNKGIKEYQAVGDAIYMTLFASCSELGKPDLLYRPGRASGDTTKKGHIRMYTPLAQELHSHHYEVAITFMKPCVKDLYLNLQKYESSNVFYQLQDINLFYERIDNKIQMIHEQTKQFPKEKSYINISDQLYIYNIYHSLYDNSIKIRFMAFEDQPKENLFDQSITLSNLLEKGHEDTIKALRIYTLGGMLS